MSHRALWSVAVICATLLLTTSAAAREASPPLGSAAQQGEFAPGQLLVRFLPAVSPGRADEILAERGAAQIRSVSALGVRVLRLPPGLSVERAVEIFSAIPEVEFAEPNYILRAVNHNPEVSGQWGLQQIQAEAAWNEFGADPPATLIAITDTGIDPNHSDLAANIWSNPGEIAGNGIDDDGNGYVDDTWGWDFHNGDNDPFDDNMHGTLVSSVTAAVKDGLGVAGVCPWCKLMAVKVLGGDGSGFLDTVASGIIYAADNGPRVINLSLGGPGGAQTLEDAVNYAWNNGVLVVAAAGNDGADARLWPAAYANAMAIASTNVDDYRSCFSNWGQDYVSVAAPGESVEGATPNQGYGTFSGTSLSTPHVSGLAGLLFSRGLADGNGNGRLNDEARSLIEASTNDLGPVGTDPYFGTGRINALRAVTNDTAATTPPPSKFTDDLSASGYAHARKLVRDGTGSLHLVWHGKDGGQYQVVYSTSTDGGATWSDPTVVFSSSAETFHPAVATDGSTLYVAFPTKDGSPTGRYRIKFASKPVSGGGWSAIQVPIGGSFNAVRPDLFVDPSNGRLHLVASSFDDAPYVYYSSSGDGGESWSGVNQFSIDSTGGQRSRYAGVHAAGSNIFVAGRSVEFIWFGLVPRYRVFTIRSLDGGNSWGSLTELALHDGWSSGEYGVSLAGVGANLDLIYEHAGSVYFRQSSDGATWTSAANLGAGAWPSITQATDGQAWGLWESGGNVVLRHHTGSSWEAAETIGAGSFPNLKLGTSGGRLDWVNTHCSGAPFRILSGSRPLGTNNPPAAEPQAATTDEETPVAITLTGSDPDGDPLTFSVLTSPTDGILSGSAPNLTYTPNPDFYGGDSFTFTVNDGFQDSDPATVLITVNSVNDPPIADDQSVSTKQDRSVAITLTASDVDGDTMTYSVVDPPLNGSLSGTAPDLTYTPNSGYAGPDSFTFLANDGAADSNVATVSITVSPNNPPLSADDSYSVDEDVTLNVLAPGVLANDTDADGDSLTALLVSEVSNGALSLNSDGSFTYTPNPNFFGSDSFTYEADDGFDLSAPATVSITVSPVNDAPVAADDAYTVAEDMTLSIGAPGVLANDSDLESDPLAAVLVGGPSNGVLTFNSDGSFGYTPNANFFGSDSFTYRANDGSEDSNIATVSISVNSVNDPPVAADDAASTPKDTPVTIDVLANDSDIDGDALAVTSATNPSDGSATVNADNTVTYTPDPDFTGTDSFTYTVSDGYGGTETATVSVNVTAPSTMRVGDLDGVGIKLEKGTWRAEVTILIQDEAGQPIAGATVTGVFTQNGTTIGFRSCMTVGSGKCTVNSDKLPHKGGKATFSVAEVTHTSLTYDASSNQDPDGDSDGTTIQISK